MTMTMTATMTMTQLLDDFDLRKMFESNLPSPVGPRSPLPRSASKVYGSWRLALLAIFLPLYIGPVLLYRAALRLCAAVFRPDLTHMLKSHGSGFLAKATHSEPNWNFVVTLHVEGSLEFDKLKALVLERVVHAKNKDGALASPEFKQFCARWGGYFFWKTESEFDINDHVIHRRLKRSEAGGVDVDSLRAEFVRAPLPKGRSPWQILAVAAEQDEDDDDDQSHVLFCKYHHVLADGFSIMQAFIGLDDEPEKVRLPLGGKGAVAVKTKRMGFVDRLTFPFRLLTCLIRMLRMSSPKLPWPELPDAPFAGGQAASERRHLIPDEEWSVTLEFVRQIARANGVSSTATICAAVTGGLREYFLAEYGPADIPSFIRSPQPFPIPFRPPGLRNLFSFVALRLPIGQPDPVARLLECERSLSECKGSLEYIVNFMTNGLLSKLPAPMTNGLSLGRGLIGVSNMPGPLSNMSIGGRRITRFSSQMGVVPFPYYITFLSYNGNLVWTSNGDARLFKDVCDVARISQLVLEEFNVLANISRKPATGNETAIDFIDD